MVYPDPITVQYPRRMCSWARELYDLIRDGNDGAQLTVDGCAVAIIVALALASSTYDIDIEGGLVFLC